MTEIDKAGWTVHQATLCECVDTRVAEISTPAGKKSVFIMDLVVPDTGVTLIKYLNVEKTPKGNYTIKHNSDFAKLYRLVIGDNPTARFSRARSLLSHLKGHQFIAEFQDAKTAQIEHYFKVTSLIPVNPIVTDEWFEYGTLRAKKKTQKTKGLKLVKLAIDKQSISNGLTKNQQKVGNGLAMKKAGEADSYLGSAIISIPQQHLTYRVEPLRHITPAVITDIIDDKYRTEITIVNGSTNYQYHQRPNETESEYHERVIDESCSTIM